MDYGFLRRPDFQRASGGQSRRLQNNRKTSCGESAAALGEHLGKAGATRPRTSMSLRKCPYCEHPNSADAKFCVACGAIMHLAPCPHCGAVNDLASKQCYRCHGELPGPDALEIPGESSPPAAPAPAPVTPAAPTSGRPSLIVVLVIALTFASAAFFATRQKSAIVAPPAATPAPAADEGARAGKITKAAETAAPAAAASNSTAPATSPVAEAASPAVAAEPAAQPVRPPRERSSRLRREAEAAAAQAAAAPASPNPATRTPCTEAVAALGLCKPDAK